jgi:hypothetical protein
MDIRTVISKLNSIESLGKRNLSEAPEDDDDSPEAKIRKQPAMSYAANHLSGNKSGQAGQSGNQNEPADFVSDKPAGDPSPMKPGEVRYNPDYDPKTGRLKSDPAPTDAPTDAPTNTPTDKPQKPKSVFNPGTKAFQHILNLLGYKVAVDGKRGKETVTAHDTAFAKLQADYTAASNKWLKTLSNKDEAIKNNLASKLELYQALNGLMYSDVVGRRNPANVYMGGPEFIKRLKDAGYDPKTGDPIKGGKWDQLFNQQAATPSDATKKDNGEVISGQSGQQGRPPADAPKNEPYWVNGTRYEWQYGRGGGNWTPTFKPGDWGLNSNQAAAKAGYTGPDSGKSGSNQSTQVAATKRDSNSGQAGQKDKPAQQNADAAKAGQQSLPSAGAKPEEVTAYLKSVVSNPKAGDHYWVNGVRYTWPGYGYGQSPEMANWYQDNPTWGANRTSRDRASKKYTGPDAVADSSNEPPKQGTPVPGGNGAIYKENSELERIRTLSGL